MVSPLSEDFGTEPGKSWQLANKNLTWSKIANLYHYKKNSRFAPGIDFFCCLHHATWCKISSLYDFIKNCHFAAGNDFLQLQCMPFDHMPSVYVQRTTCNIVSFKWRMKTNKITKSKMRLACFGVQLEIFYHMLVDLGRVPTFSAALLRSILAIPIQYVSGEMEHCKGTAMCASGHWLGSVIQKS